MLDYRPSVIPLDQLADAVGGSVDLAQQDQAASAESLIGPTTGFFPVEP